MKTLRHEIPHTPPLAQPPRPSPIPTDLFNSLECLHSSLIQLDTMIREMNKVISGVNGMLLKGGDREDPAGAWKKPRLRGRSEGSGPSCLAGWKGHQRAGQAQGNNKTNPLPIKTSHAGLNRVPPQKLLITHISHIETLLFRLSANAVKNHSQLVFPSTFSRGEVVKPSPRLVLDNLMKTTGLQR